MAVTLSATEYHYGDIFVKFKTIDEAPMGEIQGETIPVNAFGFELTTGKVWYYDEDGTWKMVGGGA